MEDIWIYIGVVIVIIILSAIFPKKFSKQTNIMEISRDMEEKTEYFFENSKKSDLAKLPDNHIKCPDCKKPFPIDKKFCIHCGKNNRHYS